MASIWRRVRLSTSLGVEEVQRRLAAATLGWSEDWWGRAVPQPPWRDAHFVASPGMGGSRLSAPLVVVGNVQAEGQSTLLTASIRPRGYFLAIAALGVAVLGAVALWAIDVTEGLFVIALLGLAAYLGLRVSIAEKSPAIEDLLAEACGGPAGARPRAGA
jgi:hypothetical protein